MNRVLSAIIFAIAEIGVMAYVLATTDLLPARLASHFNAAGAADGFMTQGAYQLFMLGFGIGLPLLVVIGITLLLRHAQESINIPNKEYWLAPERRAATVAFLQAHATWLGTFLALFMGYIHALLLQANAVQPPRLPEESLFGAMGVLLVVVLLWGLLLPWRFWRLPR